MEIFDQLKLENDDDNENNKQRRNDQFQAKHALTSIAINGWQSQRLQYV